MRKLAVLLFTLAATAAGAVAAQDLPIRVGRIAHVEGPVSLYQDPDEGWESAYMNVPLTSENSVWTDGGARAEVRVSGMAIRLDELTQLDVVRLGDDEIDAFVPSGSIALRVRHIGRNERLVVETPHTRVRIRANGRYRIDVDPERLETRVTVFSGVARVGTDDGRLRVGAGRSVIVFGDDPPQFYEEAARSDAFDRWTLARDGRWRESRAPTYVSTYMTGYEDLDSYGEWATEPDYGVLWYPRGVAATWAPYRHGRWDYVRPWGWTWIDDAPWGYAPFHYGRWVYVRNRWAWHPGERVERPVWAPALVAWIGGTNFSARISSGGPAIGWYPLSPWDRYEPWFQASPTYVSQVNVIVRDRPMRQDRRQWQQWTRERGTTVVERTTMVERRPVASAAIAFTPEVIREMQAAPQPQAVLPSRTDYIQRRRQQPQQAAPAPRVPSLAQPGAQPGRPEERAQPPGQSAIARPDFGRRPDAATPERASAPPARRPETASPGAPTEPAREAQRQQQERAQREAEQRERATRQGEDRAQREAQQRQERGAQQQQQAQERAQREAQQEQQRAAAQAQERAQREAQQQQQRGAQQQQQAQERAQREAQQLQQRGAQQQQQAQERAQREAQQEQQRAAAQAQERAQREAQQQQQRAAQQQQQAQERAQREAQQEQQRAAAQAQERAQREAQQQQQRAAQQQQQAQERAQREAQQEQQRAAAQAQERAQREAQQQQQQQQQQRAAQQQQQAQERAQREAQQQQQAQERAQREAQQQQQRAAAQAQERAQREAQQQRAAQPAQPRDAPPRARDDDDEKEKEKGKGRER